MSNETQEREDQKQTRTSELSAEKEKRLALLESEQFIRKYLNKYVATGGIILFLISFGVGFFVDRIAFQTATNQAFLSAQSEVLKLIREVMTAKSEVDNAVKSVQASSAEISKTEEKAKKFAEEFSSLQSKFESTVAFQASDAQIKEIADVLAQDPRITRVLNDLDKSIQDRLRKADEEIEKIKAAYKIDCQEDKPRALMNYNKVFTFSFPVKHAWIELAHGGDPTLFLTIVEIKDNTVGVAAKLTKTLMPRDYERRLEEFGYPPTRFHIWATSF